MKKFGLLWVLVSALMLSTYTSCEELEGLDDKNGETASGEEAFFPKTYADKELAAWYKWTETDKDKTKTEAVYLFKDSTFVVTKNKVHTDGRYERDIEAQGTYELTEGDYKNGKARAIVMAENGEAAGVMNVVIEDGHLTTDQGEEVFIMQDNAKRPKASDPASGTINGGDNGGNNNGNNNGGDNGGDGQEVQAFFPKSYAGQSIAAWYSYSGSDSGDGIEMKYVAAVYFFVDGRYVATSCVSVTSPNGQSYQRTIGGEGTYRILEGDLNTGKVSITYDKDKSMTVEIEDGQLKVIDTEDGGITIYFKQDNTKVPEPTEPIGGNDGGDQGGDDQGDSDIPAFFPKGYDKNNVVAWYSFTESNPAETRVEAIFLFNDNTFIRTERKVHSQENMQEERYIWYRGSYSFVSAVNYSNGSANIILDGGVLYNMTITDGCLVWEYNRDKVFKKRDLKDIPDPLLEPTDGNNQGGDNGGDDDSDANLSAWYTQILNMNGKDYELAIILLDDNTIVFTRTQVPDDSGLLWMTEIVAKGKYSILSGDLANGTILVYMYGEESHFTVENGVVKENKETFVEGEFIKQDNSKYTGPTDFGDDEGYDDGGDDGGDDGDDDGDDDGGEGGYIGEIQPYLPAQYAEKTVAAWYVTADIDNSKVKIESVFLFTDNTLVKTTSKFYSVSDGRDPEYKIEGEGHYELKEGDYSNGVASVVLSNGQTMTVEIVDGLMMAMDEYFAKQDNADLPDPIKAK
ncbi:MAG: hypothetical protein IKX55_07430 [Bacteroidaceae bacterium]|nr:hypothetical protein [Bacteroidaceae bacterium]